jgi:hypothetical protein
MDGRPGEALVGEDLDLGGVAEVGHVALAFAKRAIPRAATARWAERRLHVSVCAARATDG